MEEHISQADKGQLLIDAHSHLWLKQDAEWNGLTVKTTQNGRSMFLGEEVQMLPPFMIDGKNTAEVFISNMNYARVAAAVVVQEYIDGLQNDYLEQVMQQWPRRLMPFGMCEYRRPGFALQAQQLADKGFRGIAIPGHRLFLDSGRIMLNTPEMMQMFHFMQDRGMILSLCLAADNMQMGEVQEIIQECPKLKIAIGHFGLVTQAGWEDQVRLALNPNVMIESGGITWLFNSEGYPFHGAQQAIRRAIDMVGAGKLMWGSDYPRTITAITYKMSFDFVQRSSLLTRQEKDLFLGLNARRFYGFGQLDIPVRVKNMSE